MRVILHRSLIKVFCMGTLMIATQSWADASKIPNKTDPQAAVKMQMQCSLKPCNAQNEAQKPTNDHAEQQHVHSSDMAQNAQSSGVDMAHVMMKMDHSKMMMPATPSK